eukprot:4811957-Amphidinium_carterae.1
MTGAQSADALQQRVSHLKGVLASSTAAGAWHMYLQDCASFVQKCLDLAAARKLAEQEAAVLQKDLVAAASPTELQC